MGKRRNPGPQPAFRQPLSNVTAKTIKIRLASSVENAGRAVIGEICDSVYSDTGMVVELAQQALWRGLMLRGLRHSRGFPTGFGVRGWTAETTSIDVKLTPEHLDMLEKRAGEVFQRRSIAAAVAMERGMRELDMKAPRKANDEDVHIITVALPPLLGQRARRAREKSIRTLVGLTRFRFRVSLGRFLQSQIARGIVEISDKTLHGPLPAAPGKAGHDEITVPLSASQSLELENLAKLWDVERPSVAARLLWWVLPVSDEEGVLP